MPRAKIISVRQEVFLAEYIKNGGVQVEAYLKAYGGSRRNAHMNAWLLLRRPHLKRRYEQLLRKYMKKADISIEKILSDYQEALDMAKIQEKPADIVSAATAQAKLVGLLRDRVEAGGVGDFDNIDNISEILEIVSKEAGPETALALAAAFKLTTDEKATEVDQSILQEAKPASDAVN